MSLAFLSIGAACVPRVSPRPETTRLRAGARPADTSESGDRAEWPRDGRIAPGSSIEVLTFSGERTAGPFAGIKPWGIVVDDDVPIFVPRREVRWIVVIGDRNAASGALWGLGIGAGTGAIWGASVDASDPIVLPLTLMVAAIGGGLGALIGLFVPDRTVVYEGRPVPVLVSMRTSHSGQRVE
jgi:hypothetical protein